MSALFGGVRVFTTIPKGETVGAIFWHEGEKYYVTKAELDRVKSLPSAEKIRAQVEKIEAIMQGRTK